MIKNSTTGLAAAIAASALVTVDGNDVNIKDENVAKHLPADLSPEAFDKSMEHLGNYVRSSALAAAQVGAPKVKENKAIERVNFASTIGTGENRIELNHTVVPTVTRPKPGSSTGETIQVVGSVITTLEHRALKKAGETKHVKAMISDMMKEALAV